MEDNTLYHYCSFETFLAIIKNKTIQLSEITKSNDSEEIEFLWEHYISYIKANTNSPIPSHMLRYEVDNQMANTDFLVTCFSEKRDSLHMWNCYAKGGVSIGFDYNKLRDWVNGIHVFDNGIAYDKGGHYDQAHLDRVDYYSKELVEEFIESQCKNIKFVTDPFSDIFNKAPFAKTDFWEEEKEWRIAIPLIYHDKFVYDDIPEEVIIPKKVDMLVGPKGQFPLCVRCFVPFEPQMIVNITLAPDCKAELNDLKKTLHIYEFDHLNEDGNILISNGSLR